MFKKQQRVISEPLFSLQQQDEVLVLSFTQRDEIPGTDLALIGELWEFFDHIRQSPPKVLLLRVPAGLLSAEHADRFWQREGLELADRHNGRPEKRVSDAFEKMCREENAFHRFIRYVRNTKSFVVVSLAGQVMFPFLGLALACDYRIVAEDTLFLNRCAELGLPPAGAVIWFLAHNLGQAKARQILYQERTITAEEAHGLGLVEEVAVPENLEEQSLALARKMAQKPDTGLVALKRAVAATTQGLDAYLVEERDITQQFARFAL